MTQVWKPHSYYIKTSINLLIYIVFILVLMIFIASMFFIMRVLLINVFQVEQSVSDLISLIVSLLLFIIPLIPKMKNGYTKLINTIRQKLYRSMKKRTLPGNLKSTTDQEIVINQAINSLQRSRNRILALESAPGKGKTTTAIILLDNIGSDSHLLKLFIQIQNHICYIDAGANKLFLMNYLFNKSYAANSLVIIDNVHKLSAKILTEVLEQLTSLSEYAETIKCKNLFILMYQSGHGNDSTGKLLRKYLEDHNATKEDLFFDLTQYPGFDGFSSNQNQRIDADRSILQKINKTEFELLRAQLMNVYLSVNDEKLINFLLTILNEEIGKYSEIEITQLHLIAIIVLLSMYLGFVSEESLRKVWKECQLGQKEKKSLNTLLKYFYRCNFILPFPLMQKTFLFNENLAREYRKKLFHINAFRDFYYKSAGYLYNSRFFNKSAPELEWLFGIACESIDFQKIDLKDREQLFYTCLEGFNKNYVLAALEEELDLSPEKKPMYQIELGILYIKTGYWAKARKVLKPYILSHETSSQIWELQLQIIEADHGVEDDENLFTLDTIIRESSNTYIQFQAKYWRIHIQMELGNFSLEPWKDLQVNIEMNPDWLEQTTYAHFIHRITADSCRTFFLKGDGNPDFFNATLQFFQKYRKSSIRQDDLALELLECAHYIHYELVYQLGIWQMYNFPHDTVISQEDSLSREELVSKALHLYDKAINTFSKAGNKTWRTARIRRDELSLSSATPNFIQILSHLDKFEAYANENGVKVFIGYVECLRGKVLATYAISEGIGYNDDRYERHLRNALTAFQKSVKIYIDYGNSFGAFRSKFLYTLVKTIQKVGNNEDPEQLIGFLNKQIKEMLIKFHINSDNAREQQVIEFLTSVTKLKVGDLGNIIKYYPIVLQ